MYVTRLDGDPAGLREMLVRARHPTLAKDVCDDHHRPFPGYVAVSEKVAVGLLIGRFNQEYDQDWAPAALPPPQAWVFDIVVDPDHRRAGIGAALLDRFAADAAEHGCTYVALQVNRRDLIGLQDRLDFFNGLGLEILRKEADLPDIMGTSIVDLGESLRRRATATQT